MKSFWQPLIVVMIFLVMTSGALAESFPKVTSKHWTNKYDCYFKKYTKRFFGVGFDWKWFKAQAIAESNLNNNVRSWVNAKGIMQIMPQTFHEIKSKNPYIGDIDEPRWNIAAGIYYDQHLYQKWKAERPFKDRICFTFGSYNAGFMNIVKAQKKCKKTRLNENLWENIRLIAPGIRGWRHQETLAYVDKIITMMEIK